MWYYVKLNSLVESSFTATISNIDTVLNTVTVGVIPNTWVTGNIFDLIKKNGAHELRGFDLTSTDVSGNVITLPSLPSNLVVGDQIALQGESSLVQLPSIFVRVLARGVAAEMIGDMTQKSAKDLKERFNEALESALTLLQPRNSGAPKYLVNENW